jgi:hypothetical protein
MLDFLLGLVPHLEMTEGQVVDTRFGIDALREVVPAGRLLAQGVAPVGDGVVRFAAPALRREVEVRAQVRVASDPAAPDRGKVRFSAPMLDALVSIPGGPGSVQLHLPDLHAARPLGELREVSEVIALSAAAASGGSDLTVALRFNGEALGTGRIEGLATAAGPYVRWAELVRWAWTVAVAAQLPGSTAVVLSDLARQHVALQLLDAVLRPAGRGLQWESTTTQPVRHADQPWCMPLVATVRLGDVAVQIGVALIGRDELVGTSAEGRPRHQVTDLEIRHEVMRTYPAAATPEESDAALHQALIERYVEEMNVVASAYNLGEDADVAR